MNFTTFKDQIKINVDLKLMDKQIHEVWGFFKYIGFIWLKQETAKILLVVSNKDEDSNATDRFPWPRTLAGVGPSAQ